MKNLKKFLLLTILLSTAYGSEAIRIISGPYLQNVTDNEATVVWRTDKPATAWVEVAPDDHTDFYACERPRHYSTKIGRATVDTLHKVTLKGLSPDTRYRYRIFSEEVIDMVPWHVNYGGIAASDIWQHKPYKFCTLNSNGESINFKVVNDIHGDKETMTKLLENVDNENTDFVIFNGDMVSWMNSEHQVFDDFINRSSRVFASEVPFFMVRGNHETRGLWCNEYMRYFPSTTGMPYYTFKDGPVFFIVLDSGEDKPDSDIEYSRTSFFDEYREEQAKWLREVVASDDFKNAPYKVVISHMPPVITEWHGLIHAKQQFLPILNEAGIDLMLAGHFHQFIYTEAGEKEPNFPIIINSNKDVLDVNADRQHIKVDVRDTDGKVIHTYSYPAKR